MFHPILSENTTFVVNPAYKFRSDLTSVVVTNNDSLYFDVFDQNATAQKDFAWRIPPLIAYLFSFFNGTNTLGEAIAKISAFTDSTKEEALGAVQPFIGNKETKAITSLMKGAHRTFYLPKEFLVKSNPGSYTRDLLKNINIKSIQTNFEIRSVRFNIPNEFTIMLNNKCLTDCIYCYADRHHNSIVPLSISRLTSLIEEARRLGCRSIELSGGEILLHESWYELVKLLLINEYFPLISTKIPVDEQVIEKMCDLGLNRIQISLDSTNPNILSSLLHVNNSYFNKMNRALQNLEKKGIRIKIKSTISNQNDDLSEMKRLTSFLTRFSNIYEVSITPAEHSLYKPFDFATTLNRYRPIQDYIEEISPSYPCLISAQRCVSPPADGSFEGKNIKYTKRNMCSGNVSTFYLLPDGKATLCEQLYWHPFFILGDCSIQSIMEMWNSDKALSLWNIKQDEIKLTSPCKACPDFEKCRRGKGTCWRHAIQAYGTDNYDFPDYDCPYAPIPYNSVYHL